MESMGHVTVPLRSGGKKMRKRRELDALVAHSLAKRACKARKTNTTGNNRLTSQDQLLSQSTDEQDEFSWPTVRDTARCRSKRFSCIQTCGPILLVTSIFISLSLMYWLYFDLRDQFAQYRMRIEQVSATSQHVPDALQEWHETSKYLEANQTLLIAKIAEIQQSIKNFTDEFTQIKDLVHKKNEASEDNQLTVLQTNVANFGAKIKDLSIVVDDIKDHYIQLQKDVETNKNAVQSVKDSFDKQINETLLNSNNTIPQPENLTNFTKMIQDQIATVTARLVTFDDVLNQKTKSLEEDATVQKTRLDNLSDICQNTSSHVISIEDDWTKYKQNVLNFEEAKHKFDDRLISLENATNFITRSISEVSVEYGKQNNKLSNEIDLLKSKIKLEQTPAPEENGNSTIFPPDLKPEQKPTYDENKNESPMKSKEKLNLVDPLSKVKATTTPPLSPQPALYSLNEKVFTSDVNKNR